MLVLDTTLRVTKLRVTHLIVDKKRVKNLLTARLFDPYFEITYTRTVLLTKEQSSLLHGYLENTLSADENILKYFQDYILINKSHSSYSEIFSIEKDLVKSIELKLCGGSENSSVLECIEGKLDSFVDIKQNFFGNIFSDINLHPIKSKTNNKYETCNLASIIIRNFQENVLNLEQLQNVLIVEPDQDFRDDYVQLLHNQFVTNPEMQCINFLLVRQPSSALLEGAAHEKSEMIFKIIKKNIEKSKEYKYAQNENFKLDSVHIILCLEDIHLLVERDLKGMHNELAKFFNNKITIIATTIEKTCAPDSWFESFLGNSYETFEINAIDKDFIVEKVPIVYDMLFNFYGFKTTAYERVIYQEPENYLIMIEKSDIIQEMSKKLKTLLILIGELSWAYELHIERFNIEHKQLTWLEFFETFSKTVFEHLLKSEIDIVIEFFKEHEIEKNEENGSEPEEINTDTIHEVFYLFQKLISWKMLKDELKYIDVDILEDIICEANENEEIKISRPQAELLNQLVPNIRHYDITTNKVLYSWIHPQHQYFFIVDSIIKETLDSKNKPLNPKKSMMADYYISKCPDLLNFIADHVSKEPLQIQYSDYFDCWYKTVLLTRELLNCTDENLKKKTEIIASNCMSMLAAIPNCDLKDRDFSGCHFSNVSFEGKNISKSNFSRCKISNCYLAETVLTSCNFENSELNNIKKTSVNTLSVSPKFIETVAFSPCGKIFASSGADYSITLWKTESLQRSETLRGHTGSINQIVFSHDAKIIVSASDDCLVRVWNVQKHRMIWMLEGHTDSVKKVTFSIDSKMIASGSADGVVKVWDVESKTEIVTIKRQEKSIKCLEFSPDGKFLLLGEKEGPIELWDTLTLTETSILEKESELAESAAFSPDSKMLVWASEDSTLKLEDLQSRGEISVLRGHSDLPFCVTFSPDSKLIASGGMDYTIKLWCSESKSILTTLKRHTNWVRSVVFSPNSRLLVSCSYDNTINVWDVQDYLKQKAPEGHSDSVQAVQFSPDSRVIASGSSDCTVKLWDAQSRSLITTLRGHKNIVQCVAFSPDYKMIASGSHDNTIRLWSMYSKQEAGILTGHSKIIYSIAFAPNSQILASGSQDQTIKLWDVQSQREIATLQGHSNSVTSVAFSADSKLLASGSWDNTIKLWDYKNETQISTLIGHQNWVWCIAFSPDCQLLASGSYDKTIKLWHVQSQQEVETLSGHESAVHDVTFSPDSRLLASGTLDHKIRLWDVKLKTQIDVLHGHQGNVNSVSFSSDCQMLVSGSDDYTVEVWDLQKNVPISKYLQENLLEENNGEMEENELAFKNKEEHTTLGEEKEISEANSTGFGNLNILEGLDEERKNQFYFPF